MERSRTSVSRTSAVVLVVVVLVIAGVAAYYAVSSQGPGSTSSSSSTTTTSTGRSSLKYESTYKPFSLDPASGVDPGSVTYLENVYENLVTFEGNTSTVVPWLARSWTISANGTVYTFQLREGVKFQDGSDFNATVAKFSLDRFIIMNQPTALGITYVSPIAGVQDYLKSNLTQADVSKYLAAGGITAVGPYTLQIKLIRSYAPLLDVLASFDAFGMVSEKAVKANGGVEPGKPSDYMNTHMIGTGPYLLRTYDAASGNGVLQAWSGYWGGPNGSLHAKITTVFNTVVADENSEVLDLKAGTADIVYVTGSSTFFQLFDRNSWLTQHKIVPVQQGLSVYGPVPFFQINQFSMNFQVRALNGSIDSFQPFSDSRVRKAFTLAFNQTEYIRSQLNGLGLTINGPIPGGVVGYDPSIPPPPFDLTEAKRLLTEAGPSVGFSPSNPKTIPVYFGSGQPDAEAAAAEISSNINGLQVGLNLAPTPLQFPQLISYYFHKQFIFGTFGIGRPGDPFIWLQDYGNGIDGQLPPLNSYNDTALTQLIIELGTTTNDATRITLAHDAVSMLNSDYSYVWVNQAVAFFPFASNLKGVVVNPNFQVYYFATMSFG